MYLLQRLLLIPLLTPLLVVLLVGAINPRPLVSLRLLIWSSPALPIGIWLGLAAAGGAGLSALASALALQTAPAQIRRSEDGPRPPREAPAWPDIATGPVRAPGDPAPTVAVPFRVIRRGTAAATASTKAATASAPVGSAPARAESGEDSWGQNLSDDW
ncbi:hypothetical protein KBY58_10890 [Cyanobium sp. HWJ4-Hawea]|uniref:hypothetical protein n=1 Tax=Cyanobium sp. HWJ4-Hawea TaxID=2823713 RepID=UPI0020CDEFF3|nr:hypothetical protein [Cyanobium sp. HWJ4-Hawea]MCP9809940.1 hypothetical protein [Cyanobium sp. HWJ4-Hawea]